MSEEEEETTSKQASTSAISAKKLSKDIDSLNTEFIYYSAILRTYAPGLSREFDKGNVHLWMRKLFGPEYHSTVLKPKRNKYLLYLSITIFNDEAYGIFKQNPPCGKLPEIKDIPFDQQLLPAAWEVDMHWKETLSDLPDDLRASDCYLHDSECPTPEDNICRMLDDEFQFFLWLGKPYVALLHDPEERLIAACWVQLLCGLAPEPNDCYQLKQVRNDYMQALIGYVHDLRVDGPFRLMPPGGPVPPLEVLYEDCRNDSSRTEKEAEEFLASQQIPESGAFAYINVTGELFESF